MILIKPMLNSYSGVQFYGSKPSTGNYIKHVEHPVALAISLLIRLLQTLQRVETVYIIRKILSFDCKPI